MKLAGAATVGGGMRIGAAHPPLQVDYSGLWVHRTPWEVLSGHAGYRPIPLIVAAAILLFVAFSPVPGSLLDLVERVNPSGYDMMEPGTHTILDSTNLHRDPVAFEAWRSGGGPVAGAAGVASGQQAARVALIMVGILVVAALLWGTEALPIAGTVTLVAEGDSVVGLLTLTDVFDMVRRLWRGGVGRDASAGKDQL